MCTPVFIIALFLISRTWKQPRCPLVDEWIRKLWYVYIMEYYSTIKKNTFQSVLMRWMKLEPIIQNEDSQKEKHQQNKLTHICGIQKDDNHVCENAKKTQMYKTVFWTLGDGEGGMIWENGTDTCIITQVNELPVQVQCMIQDAWGWCTGITRRDGMRREVAGDFRMGHTCTPVADSCLCMAKPVQYCKAIRLQLK